jgi:hypothetical protein
VRQDLYCCVKRVMPQTLSSFSTAVVTLFFLTFDALDELQEDFLIHRFG